MNGYERMFLFCYTIILFCCVFFSFLRYTYRRSYLATPVASCFSPGATPGTVQRDRVHRGQAFEAHPALRGATPNAGLLSFGVELSAPY